jgi:hypothetical protein
LDAEISRHAEYTAATRAEIGQLRLSIDGISHHLGASLEQLHSSLAAQQRAAAEREGEARRRDAAAIDGRLRTYEENLQGVTQQYYFLKETLHSMAILSNRISQSGLAGTTPRRPPSPSALKPISIPSKAPLPSSLAPTTL